MLCVSHLTTRYVCAAAKYEGTNGPYPTPAAMGWLASLGASSCLNYTAEGRSAEATFNTEAFAEAKLKTGLLHLLLDLPSADREVRGNLK